MYLSRIATYIMLERVSLYSTYEQLFTIQISRAGWTQHSLTSESVTFSRQFNE